MIEVEVMCLHYIGTLQIEPLNKEFSLFSIYIDRRFIGHIQSVQCEGETRWYSHQITDKELVSQAGEWAAHYFPIIN